MGNGWMTFRVLLLCGMLPSVAFCQTTAPAAPRVSITASQLLDMRMSADPKMRASVAKRFFSQQIGADLANPDPSVQSSALAVLKKLLKEDLHDPAGPAAARRIQQAAERSTSRRFAMPQRIEQ